MVINILHFNSTTKEYTIFVSYTDNTLSNSKEWAGNIEIPNIFSQVNVPDLSIKSGKTLTIKRSGTANTQRNSQALNITNFTWPSKLICKNGAYLSLESGSNVIIKDTSTFELESNATLEIQNGSTFNVKDYSSFKIHPNAKIIVKENGKLLIEESSTLTYLNSGQIILEGPNSILEFKSGGKILIGENATFNYSGNGFIKINTDNSIYPIFRAIGQNARVKIVTSGFNFNSKKILEITGGSYVCDYNKENSNGLSNFELNELSFQNGLIQLDRNTGIAISGKNTKTDLRNLFIKARIENTANERHFGIVLNGQKGNSIYKVSIRDGVNGITSNNYYGGNNLDLLQYNAFSCEIGIQINGAGARIQDCKINDCKTAILLQGMYGSTRLYRGEIFNCSVGVLAVNCGSTVIELYQPNIHNNFNGVYASNSLITGNCGKVFNNAAANMVNGKYEGANFHLNNLSNLTLDPTFRPGIGNVDLSNVRGVSVRLEKSGTGPLISNSQSNLETGLDYSIVGNINRNLTSIPLNIFSKMNFWRSSSGTSFSPVHLIDYKVINSIAPFSTNFVYYQDPNPISNFQICGTGSIGSTGGDDRFKGFLSAPISILEGVSDFQLSDGNNAKNSVFEGFQFGFDLFPNYELAINSLMKILNHQFTQEQFQNWKEPIVEINTQMIEFLKNGIEDKRLEKDANFELINNIITLQNKLMTDFRDDSSQFSGFQIKKVEVFRLIENYQEAIQTLSDIDLQFSPNYEGLKSSLTCMINNEVASKSNFSALIETGYGLHCFSEIDYNNMVPFEDTTNYQGVLKDSLIIFTESTNDINVYPIPTSSYITIGSLSLKEFNCEIEIYDNQGKLVRKQNVNVGKNLSNQVFLGALESGIYQIIIKYSTKQELHKIVIIKD